MNKSIRNKINAAVSAVMIAFVIISFLLTHLCIILLSSNYKDTMAETAVEFVSSTIDPDSARAAFVSGEHDESFDSVQEVLYKYIENTNSVNRISFINFSNTSGTYIYDTGGAVLGQVINYDDYTVSVRAELINGRNSWVNSSGSTVSAYSPLRTSDDALAGYVIVEMNEPFSGWLLAIAVLLYLILLAAGVLLTRLFSRFMDRMIFQPVQDFTDTSLRLTEEGSDHDTRLNAAFFERDDEIGQLGGAINKMVKAIKGSAENLSQAIFDANHDGMTGTLNKRCYHDMKDQFPNYSSICVIYFDVNNLKQMNDTLGHESGDHVIKRAAAYIMKLLSEKDYCFRMGGDEFLMIMTNCTFREIDAVVEKLDGDSPYILNRGSDPLKCALSYGYAYAKGNYDYTRLITEAEDNMYVKKSELKQLLQTPDR